MKQVEYSKYVVKAGDTDGLVFYYQGISNYSAEYLCISSCLWVN